METMDKNPHRTNVEEVLVRLGQAIEQMRQPSDLGHLINICLNGAVDVGLDIQSMALHWIVNPEENMVETFRMTLKWISPENEIRYSPTLIDRWKNNRFFYVADLEDSGEEYVLAFRKKLDNLPILSFVDVPFSRGILCAHSCRKDAFSEIAIGVLKEIATIFSVGIARLEDMMQLLHQNQALHKLNLELEHRVKERTFALEDANRKLQKEIAKRKKMEEALLEAERDRVLIETAGAAAHEINQPLTVIMGLTELMRTMPDCENIQKDLAFILQSCQAIHEILCKMETVKSYRSKVYVGDVKIVDFGGEAKISP